MEVFCRLKRVRALRRIIEGALAGLALVALLIFLIEKENSKIVSKIEVTPFLSIDNVQYANPHAVGILISALLLALFLSALLADLLLARIYYREIDGEDVIVCNGLGHIRLLVNGEERDVMFLKAYLETTLNSGVTLTVSPQFFLSYHIAFSDRRPAIDL